MASLAVMTAVETRLAAQFSSLPIYAINTVGKAPDALTGFVVVEYPVTDAGQMSAGSPGSNVIRESGAFRVVINAPTLSGRTTAGGYAATIATAFRNVRFEDVQTWVPVTHEMGERGAYYQFSVVVPYQYDTLNG